MTCKLIKGGQKRASERRGCKRLTFATPSVYEHSEGRSALLLDDLVPTVHVSNLVAQNMWSRLRRILWLQKPKEAIPDCYCGWKYLYFDASYVAHIQLSTLGSQIRATYARGDLVLNPQSVVLLPRLSRDSQRCFKRAVS